MIEKIKSYFSLKFNSRAHRDKYGNQLYYYEDHNGDILIKRSRWSLRAKRIKRG